MTDDQLVDGFIAEARLADPTIATTYEERRVHVFGFCAFASELMERHEASRLIAMLEHHDMWIVCCAAERLAHFDGMDDIVLTAFDRICSVENSSLVGRLADLCRSAIRRGDASITD